MYSSPIGRGTTAPKKVTAPDVRARKGGPALAMVTAYDFTMARLLDEAGVDLLLVGDSLGMVVQGLANTLPVTLDEIAYHSRAVARAAGRAHVVADMPFMSYQVSAVQALESAGKLMKEGAFESVKLEGGEEVGEVTWRPPLRDGSVPPRPIARLSRLAGGLRCSGIAFRPRIAGRRPGTTASVRARWAPAPRSPGPAVPGRG